MPPDGFCGRAGDMARRLVGIGHHQDLAQAAVEGAQGDRQQDQGRDPVDGEPQGTPFEAARRGAG
jgi:hypothetical protein